MSCGTGEIAAITCAGLGGCACCFGMQRQCREPGWPLEDYCDHPFLSLRQQVANCFSGCLHAIQQCIPFCSRPPEEADVPQPAIAQPIPPASIAAPTEATSASEPQIRPTRPQPPAPLSPDLRSTCRRAMSPVLSPSARQSFIPLAQQQKIVTLTSTLNSLVQQAQQLLPDEQPSQEVQSDESTEQRERNWRGLITPLKQLEELFPKINILIQTLKQENAALQAQTESQTGQLQNLTTIIQQLNRAADLARAAI